MELINGVEFMKEGDTLEVVVHAESETALFADMPTHVILEVTYTEPGLKGDTATNTLKPATMENGAIVRVPLFINIGEKIKVDTRDGSYVERAK
jgi:elongation factor P